MLFDFVQAAFDSPQRNCTDLSRGLRDGVSLYLPPSHVTHSTSDEMTDLAVVPMTHKLTNEGHIRKTDGRTVGYSFRPSKMTVILACSLPTVYQISEDQSGNNQ
jgi:hypothetical protein